MRDFFKNTKTKEAIIVVLFFVIGIAFRLWFVSLAPQPPYYDQDEYETYAGKIMDHGMLASNSYRTYPYPLLLAVTYTVVGFGNRQAIFFLQAVADSLTGVMVFWVLAHAFRHSRARWIGLLVYALNPFTSGYVGVLLSEILATFFIAATVVAGLLFLRRPTWYRGIIFGFCAGFVAETRNAAFVWAAVPILLTLFWVSWKKYARAYVGVLAGLILTMVYPLYVNWRDFHEINMTTVDSFYAKELYNGAVLRRLPPFTYWYPPDVQEMYHEYYSEFYPGRSTAERRAIANKYYEKAWAIVRSDPWDYMKVRLDKMWYVWQKENVFFYSEPGFEQHRPYTYTLNLTMLLLAAFGLIVSRRGPSDMFRIWTWWVIVGTIIYGTLVFSFSHAEYRLTIPFYPLLFIAAANGAEYVLQKTQRLFP